MFLSYCRDDSAAVNVIEDKMRGEGTLHVFRGATLPHGYLAGADAIGVELLRYMIHRCVLASCTTARVVRRRPV
jgi:hypothetical protein